MIGEAVRRLDLQLLRGQSQFTLYLHINSMMQEVPVAMSRLGGSSGVKLQITCTQPPSYAWVGAGQQPITTFVPSPQQRGISPIRKLETQVPEQQIAFEESSAMHPHFYTLEHINKFEQDSKSVSINYKVKGKPAVV